MAFPIVATTGMFRGDSVAPGKVVDLQGLLTISAATVAAATQQAAATTLSAAIAAGAAASVPAAAASAKAAIAAQVAAATQTLAATINSFQPSAQTAVSAAATANSALTAAAAAQTAATAAGADAAAAATSAAAASSIGTSAMTNAATALAAANSAASGVFGRVASAGGDAGSTLVVATGFSAPAATLSDRFSDMPNLRRDFGVLGDGSTADTARFKAALTTAGRSIFVPPGTLLVSDTLPVPAGGVRLVGAGRQSTIILQTNPLKNVVDWAGVDGQLEGLTLGYTGGVPDAASVGLNAHGPNFTARNLSLFNTATAIRASAGGIGQYYQQIIAQQFSQSAFWADGASDLYLAQFLFLGGGLEGTTASAQRGAIRVTSNTEAFNAVDGEVFVGMVGLSVSGPSQVRGQCPAFCSFRNIYFDSSTASECLVDNSLEMDFDGCWFAGGRTAGASGFGAAVTNSTGTKFRGNRFVANGGHGLVLGTGARGTIVTGNTFDSNGSQMTAGTAAGVAVTGGVTDFTITSNRFGNGLIPVPVGGVQAYSVQVLAGASDRYIIHGNQTSSGGAIVDGGTGTNKFVAANF